MLHCNPITILTSSSGINSCGYRTPWRQKRYWCLPHSCRQCEYSFPLSRWVWFSIVASWRETYIEICIRRDTRRGCFYSGCQLGMAQFHFQRSHHRRRQSLHQNRPTSCCSSLQSCAGDRVRCRFHRSHRRWLSSTSYGSGCRDYLCGYVSIPSYSLALVLVPLLEVPVGALTLCVGIPYHLPYQLCKLCI